jgi:hypothetical protein
MLKNRFTFSDGSSHKKTVPIVVEALGRNFLKGGEMKGHVQRGDVIPKYRAHGRQTRTCRPTLGQALSVCECG